MRILIGMLLIVGCSKGPAGDTSFVIQKGDEITIEGTLDNTAKSPAKEYKTAISLKVGAK